ncbi:DEAD/DEAH box helicase domain protein [Solidesulfovibrio carbinoliphilus subsp. oakridgensis]|uniref:DEAD-box ATP-dependent RNA helicase RhpA n=1 Tax=Solidesulfovibrio carbinoliphilus subsp. oakridgensis TaxID=694327 RepID=G7Q997_9BACT|nr:DEAD/DEAH box helicase [Solidesulfovibrio carbinoliphilus]EHJ48140.1 DEAD/DEAH box helicase domain protein [Solidesulfovibrio carbinoliphilus subsp. oakridgensis]
MSFDSFCLHATITENIKRLGYENPTPIQAEAIPHVTEGRDLMGLAQTGTGKTAAFLLPIIHRLMTTKSEKRGVRALILAPTRELAEQIYRAGLDLGRGTRLRAAVIYGGVGMFPQTRALRQGVDIIVACPGRLLDHMNQGNVRFDALETLVLDEADHMFDMGFLPDIKRILSALPSERQTLLFSATMPPAISGLAHETLTDPVTVRIGHMAPLSTVEHAIYPISHTQKAPLLLHLLEEAGKQSVIVFTRTKHRAKNLALQLCRSGHKATCLQGNLSQRQRQIAMDGFRRGSFQVLVATDIAARGIDVSQVGHVVNFDIPDTAEAYTHRIGRTGRAEHEGQAHTFVTGEDMGMVRAIESHMKKPLPRREVEGFEPDPSEFRRSYAPAPRYPARGRQGGYGGRPQQGGYRGQGDRARSSDRPQGERSFSERPQGDRPRDDRARPDTRTERPRQERPQAARSHGNDGRSTFGLSREQGDRQGGQRPRRPAQGNAA